MHISPLEEYAIRCALRLAQSYAEGPLSASQIAHKEGLSTEYASKIMHLFKKAGIVQAERGAQGGFRLSATPTEVKLSQLFSAVDTRKDQNGEFCSHFRGQGEICVHHGECSIRPVWALLNTYFDKVLQAVSLQDLLQRESSTGPLIQNIVAKTAKTLETKLKAPAMVAGATEES